MFPQSNSFRQKISLDGFWDFRFDPKREGEARGWFDGVAATRPIAVPASWNDQFADERDNLGPAWYQTRFDLPWGWRGQRIYVRFGSVNYLAEVWLNGIKVGRHEGGHLPFDLDLTDHVREADNLLVVRVDGNLTRHTVPPGDVPPDPLHSFAIVHYPSVNFDFFPYCGIHRPVLLYTKPSRGIDDVTVITDIEDSTGIVQIKVAGGVDDATVRVKLRGHGVELVGESAAREITFNIRSAALWNIGEPNLYEVIVDLIREGEVCDRYLLRIGIRTIKVDGNALLLNGKPIYLKGFGRHEDFFVVGRGLLPSLIIKDYDLMRWVGANSFRTSHYPYSDEMMDLADQLGVLVIDETPAVGLFFDRDGLAQRLALCRQQVREMIARDKNHPSVVMWSLANEPHSHFDSAHTFIRDLYDLAKSLDPTRPITITSHVGIKEESFEFLDVVCLNRYYGWYTEAGQIDAGVKRLAEEIDAIHARYPKPFILTEFGADATAGFHAQPAEMFSEEFQAEMIAAYIDVLRARPFVAGEHVWTMCDFKTAQAVRRMNGMNYKGVFTRDRKPKLAAHRLKEIWKL